MSASAFFCRDAGSRAREIRYEQEQEFQEALKKDQEREKKIAMEELRRQEEAAEEKRKQKDEERARKAEQYRYFFGCITFTFFKYVQRSL